MTGTGYRIRTPWQVMRASIYTLVVRNLEARFIMKSSNKRLLDLFIIFADANNAIIDLTTNNTNTHL